MRQEEFFQSFQEALTGEVSDGIIRENINYYKNYIYQETQKGRSLDEVLDALGNPRLLAKTIINTTYPNAGGSAYSESKNTYDSNAEYKGYEEAKDHRTIKQRLHEIQMPSWVRSLLSLVVIIVVIFLTFTVISYLAPFILFVVCIFAVIRFIKMISDGT